MPMSLSRTSCTWPLVSNGMRDYTDPESDVSKAGALNGVALTDHFAGFGRAHPPGKVFNYNTGEANLVGEVLRAAIGNNASTYLTQKIWQPFGMEFDATWLIDQPGGVETGGCCISASLRDYARLGLFAMHDGVLPSGERVLPEGWMTASDPAVRGIRRLWLPMVAQWRR
jgi:CubicO group peptidase (beta-lactamase class C family)